MYTIKVAAQAAGVSVEALRAWERRYGVVRPVRSDSGYRLYDDDAIARLRAMRTLTRAGWSARLAAEAVIERGPAAADLVQLDEARARPAVAADHIERIVTQFVEAAAALDGRAVADLLDEMFSLGSFERVTQDLLFPALRAMGDAWTSGAVSVAAEHAASNAVARRLAAALDAAGRPVPDAHGIVVGLPPTGRHELGALAFATVARRSGLAVTYVGADLPVADWVSACEAADAAVIAVVVDSDIAPARRVANTLHAAHPTLLVALGGPKAPQRGDHLWLPDGPVDALEALRAALGS
jgi:DNA-binding transcriptional MerR regulator